MKRFVVAAFALGLSGAANAQLKGVVVDVPDGDTLAVRIEQQVVNINLKNIDAPEAGQPYSKRSQESLAELCGDKPVALDELGVDRERHIFGEAECGGVDAAEEQVKRGMAWAARRGAAARSGDAPLKDLEAEARAQHRGLWIEAAPVPPWEWSAIFTQ